jgi:alkylation response protein AidB-like acyl-CoA dehydrogenase
MVNLSLSESQLALQRAARGFADGTIRPAVRALKSVPDAPDRWALVEPVFRAGAALGFTRMLLPAEDGGVGLSCLEACLVMEELAAADIAIAADCFSLTATVPLMLSRGGTPAQRSRLLPRFVADRGFLAAGAQSEPDVGGSELMYQGEDTKIGPRTLARRVEGGYLLNGRKSAFITNAGHAEGFFILARTSLEQPVSRTLSVFFIPAGTPGLSVGRDTELIGWSSSSHAPVYLDDVFVPEEDRIGAEGQAGMLFGMVPEMPACLAACFVGLARAAYDYALDYARNRVSNGRPILEHQSVALKLADMAVEVQSARLMVWDAAHAAAADPMQAACLKGPAAKTFAVDAAIRNAERAVQVLGGYGVARDYDAGAMLADAWVGYSCDFTRDVLRLGMVPFLQPH